MEGGRMAMKQKYIKEEVAKMLQEIGWLSTKEIGQHPNLPSLPTILKLFKTTKMSDVWEELDIFGV